MDSSSSVSLLHSIYGSQASQLLFSDNGSESSFSASKPGSLSNMQRRMTTRVRPKSSPASTIASRMQLRKQSAVELTVQRTPLQQQISPDLSPLELGRPGEVEGVEEVGRPIVRSAGGYIRGTVRPASAAVTSQRSRRPPSASGQRKQGFSRPKTALGIVS